MANTNGDVKEILTQWLINDADILPSRASTYSTQLINAGVGSVSRLSKKIAKNSAFLQDVIRVDDDDADEIISAVLRFKNVERANKMKVKLTDLSVTTRPPSTPRLRHSDDNEPHPETEQQQNRVSDSLLGCPPSSSPQMKAQQPTLSPSSPLPVPSSHLPSSSTKKKSRSASLANFKFTSGATSHPDLLNKFATPIKIPEDPSSEFGGAAGSQGSGSSAEDEYLSSVIAQSLRLSSTSTSTSLVSSSSSSPPPSPMSPKPTLSPRSPDANEHKRLSLKHMSWGSSGSGGYNCPKDALEIETVAKSVMFELTMSIDSRSELECLSALSRLHQHPASDLTYYQDALAAEGAPKALSVVLSLFSASTRICLEAVKVVSLLCQHSDNRSSLHADNTEGLGGHGACYSVIRILASPTHVSNEELVEETCRVIGKLSLCEGNNKIMTSGDCCEALVALMREDETEEGQTRRPGVVMQATKACRLLSERSETMSHLLGINFCEAIVACLSRYLHDTAVVLELLTTIITIGRESKGACARLGDCGACGAVLRAVSSDVSRATVFEVALTAIQVLLDNNTNLPRLLQASFCDVLVESLQVHASVANVAINASRVLLMFSSDSIVRSKLSSAGVCELMRNLLSAHMNSPSVTQALCGAVAALAANHTENKAQLMSAGVGEFVVMAMHKYSAGESKLIGTVLPKGSDTVVWQASWSLEMLAVGFENSLSRLQTGGVCEAVNEALQRHSTSNAVVRVLRAIIVLAGDATHSIIGHVGDSGVCKSLVKVMSKNSRDLCVCQLGCEAIVRLGAQSVYGEQNRVLLASAKASEVVSNAIMTHASADTLITERGCQALLTLCRDDSKARTSGEIEAVVWAIQRQGNFEHIAECASEVVVALSKNPSNAMRFGGHGGCEAIINLLKTHSRVARVCELACDAVHFLALNENNRAWLGASGGCDAIGTVMHHHTANAVVCRTATLAVGHLACNHDGNSSRLRSIGVCERVLEVLEKHVNDEACADNSCYAVYELSQFRENMLLMSELQVCEKVVSAMIAHRDVDAVDKHSLQAIQRLSLKEHKNNLKVLSDPVTLHHIVAVLSSQEVTSSCEVAIEGCKVINHLAVIESNKAVLGDAGACRAVVTMLKVHHSRSESLVAHAAVACAMLAKDCQENITRFIDQSSCELFLECLDEHKASDSTTISVYQCLFYLSTSSMARTLMLENDDKRDIFRDIVKLISRHKTDGRGVFWCLRLLVSLIVDDDSREKMHRTNAYKVIPSIALGLKEDKHVVLAALLALEAMFLNCSGGDEYCVRLCGSDVSDLVIHSLKMFSGDVSVSMAASRVVSLSVGVSDISGGGSCGDLAMSPPSSPVSAQASRAGGSSGRRLSAWDTLKGKFSSMRSSGGGSSRSRSGSSTLLSADEAIAATPSSQNYSQQKLHKAQHQVRLKLGTNGACASVVRMLIGNMDDQEVVSCACQSLVSLSQCEPNIALIGDAGGVDILVTALKQYGLLNKALIVSIAQLIAALTGVSSDNPSTCSAYSRHFGELGACGAMASALSCHYKCVNSAEACCNAIHHLSRNNTINQTCFGESGLFGTLENVFQYHLLNQRVCGSAARALYSVLHSHHQNCALFSATVHSPHLFVELLTDFVTDLEIVKYSLWALSVVRRHSPDRMVVEEGDTSVRQVNVSVPEESGDDGDEGTMINQLDSGSGAKGVLSVSPDRVGSMVSAIQQHYTDEDVASYGCALIASLLIWGGGMPEHGSNNLPSADGRVYLLNSTHKQLTSYFFMANACDVLRSLLTHHSNNEAVTASILLSIGLLLRPKANSTVVTIGDQNKCKTHELSGFGDLSDCEMVLKVMHKHNGHADILKSSALVLSNVLFGSEDDAVLHFVGSASMVKSVVGYLLSHCDDAGVARSGCVLISRLSVSSEPLPHVLISAGVTNFLVKVLSIHTAVPAAVEHALNALHALTIPSPAAHVSSSSPSSITGELGSTSMCQVLASVFSEYPVSSMNEPVAFSLCRSLASLCEGSGNNCLRLGKVGVCEDLVKVLIHFLNGSYIAIIRDSGSGGMGSSGDHGDGDAGRAAYCELIAMWSCRAIGSLAKDPSAWTPQSTTGSFTRNPGVLTGAQLNVGGTRVTGGGFNENRVTLGDVGACEAIAQVIKKYSDDEEIFISALWAAANLLCDGDGDDGSNRRKFMGCDVGGMVVEGVKKWRGDERVVEWGLTGKINEFEDLSKLLTAPVTKSLPESWQGEYTVSRAQQWVNERQEEGAIVLSIKTKQDIESLVGFVILFAVTDEHTESLDLRLGYFFAEQSWGLGYASEVVKGLIVWERKNTSVAPVRVRRVLAGVSVDNPASKRVLLKCGFKVSEEDGCGGEELFQFDL